MITHQLIKDELGNPIFAIVPYKEYLALLKSKRTVNHTLKIPV